MTTSSSPRSTARRRSSPLEHSSLSSGRRRPLDGWPRAGVRTGDAVVLQAPADLKGTEILAAVWLLHAIPSSIATTATVDEVAHAIRETGARYAVVAPAWHGATWSAHSSPQVICHGCNASSSLVTPLSTALWHSAPSNRFRSLPDRGPIRGRWPASSTRRARRQRQRECSTATRRCCADSPRARRRQQSDARDLPRRPCGFADQSSPTTDGRWDNGRDGPLERPRRSRAD